MARCVAGERELTHSVDEGRLVSGASRLHVDKPLRPVVDRHVLAFQRETVRAWADDHDNFSIPNGPNDQGQV